MNDQAIEQQIQAKGKTAPRVTPADIEANIAHEVYFVAADAVRFAYLTSDPADHEQRERKNSIIDSLPTRSYSGACIDIDANTHVPASLPLLTFCVLVLRNGFTVTGESACASPENFDAEIGRNIARQNAVQKIWPLMGYQLREELHRRAVFDAEPKTGTGANLAELPPAPGAAHAGYSTMQPHQQRVVDERAELDGRLAKLNVFIDGATFSTLDVDSQNLLKQQAATMAMYSDILTDRITAFAPAAD